jgi:hypothetical protein
LNRDVRFESGSGLLVNIGLMLLVFGSIFPAGLAVGESLKWLAESGPASR